MNRHTVLRPRQGVRLLLADNGIRIPRSTHPGGTFVRDGLAILAAFTPPCSVDAALSRLQATYPGDVEGWKHWAEGILGLCDLGVLEPIEPVAGRSAPGDGSSYGYGDPADHILMLNDRQRTLAYLDAIARMVRPGDCVIDLGTGTGVYAVAAVRAGARQVYAIEATRIADAAAEVFRVNGVSDRITLIRGWSTHLEVPERADLVISELLSHDAVMGEGLLELTRDARQRFLKPTGRMIPGLVRLLAVPVTLAEPLRARWRFTDSHIEEWNRWYGIDFTPLLAEGMWGDGLQGFLRHDQAELVTMLSDPVLLVEFDLHGELPDTLDITVPCQISSSGRVDGVLIFFEAVLAPGVSLSTEPGRAGRAQHWRNPVSLLAHSRIVEAGDHLDLRLSYQIPHMANGVHVT